ncbi:MAG: hypothetical protein PHW34_15695 [Hespellia sp.]|nr:hypothetical protein [Hespellia sp.]
MPKGELLCAKCRQYVKWYISNHSHPIYLPKKDRKIAEALALKKYYTLQLEELSEKNNYLDHYLKRCKNRKHHADDLLEDDSPYKELLMPFLQSHSEKITEWINTQYNSNPNYPEYLLHQTFSGHKVRSKSEVIIANTLFTNKIPYRYECALTLDEATYYPDFTILHPQTEKLYYWEHFGMLDKTTYRNTALNKMNNYIAHDIIPSINLITTYETYSHPINSKQIQHIVKDYFL